MKRLLLISFLLFAFTASAQTTRYGFKLGINVSDLSGDAFEDATNRLGFAGGFFVTIPLNTTLSFQPEFLYSGQGVKPGTSSNIDQREEFDYLQLPLLLRGDFNRVHLLLGPQAGIGVWNSFTSNFRKTMDYSILGGVGIDVTSGVFVEARYSLGLRNVIDDGLPVEAKNRYFQMMVGYRF